MKTIPILLCGFVLLLTFNSCRSIRELKALARCEFRVKEISKLDVGGVNALNIQSLTDLNMADAARLGLAFKNGSLPLTITFNLEARNPNDKLAALEKLDWILEVDKSDMLNGTTVERFEVPASGGLNSMPITTSIDIRKILGKETLSSILNVVAGIKGENEEETRIRLKIKPRFIVAGITMGYPGFIKVGKTFKSDTDKD
jgi:hypothetical protein